MAQQQTGVGAAAPLLPPRATSDGTLRRFQEVALAGFAERGFHGVSVRDLAAATGVKASSLYAHTASKEQLLRDLVLLGHEEHRDLLRSAVLSAGADPFDQLRAVVTAHVTFHAQYPLLATVANNERHALSPQGAAEVDAVRGDAEGLLLDVVQRGVRQGSFHCPDPWLAVAAIGGMGIRVAAWFREDGPYSIADVCERYADFACRIVA